MDPTEQNELGGKARVVSHNIVVTVEKPERPVTLFCLFDRLVPHYLGDALMMQRLPFP